MSTYLSDEDRETVRQMAYAGSYSQEKAARYVTTVEGIVARKVAEALAEQRKGIAQAIEALPGPGHVGIKGWPASDQEAYLLGVEEAARIAEGWNQ